MTWNIGQMASGGGGGGTTGGGGGGFLPPTYGLRIFEKHNFRQFSQIDSSRVETSIIF
jgi:hypothetical protein